MTRMQLRAILAAFVTLLFIVPSTAAYAGPAQAPSRVDQKAVGTQASICMDKYYDQYPTGQLHIYWNTDCNSTPICSYGDDDNNYATTPGCSGTNDNTASSVLNLGYDNGSYQDVLLYRLSGYGGGYICVPNGGWIQNLADRTFSDGVNADNRISSHRWATYRC